MTGSQQSGRPWRKTLSVTFWLTHNIHTQRPIYVKPTHVHILHTCICKAHMYTYCTHPYAKKASFSFGLYSRIHSVPSISILPSPSPAVQKLMDALCLYPTLSFCRLPVPFLCSASQRNSSKELNYSHFQFPTPPLSP